MADKARPFSIHLLRPDFTAENALVEDHELEAAQADDLYISDAERKRPWWKAYFGIKDDIWQEFKGALLFLPVDDRWFALCFGQVQYNFKDVS